VRVLAVGNIYLPHAPGGGYEITWRSAMAQLRGRGDEVRVLVSVHREPGVGADAVEDPDVHRELPWYWRDHDFPRRGLRERREIERSAGAVLQRHLDEFRPDAVCWWGMGGLSLGLIERVRQAGIPAVGVVGDEWMVWGTKVDAWYRLQRRMGLARVDIDHAAVWLFNSDEVRRRSLASWPGLADARVAHPGIDDSLFVPALPRADWRWRLLYLGRMDERKGVHIAVESLQHLREATLVIQGRGDPSYVEHLKRRAAELGVLGRIEFSARPRAELGSVYADADAVLFPVQWDEPWGLVPLEAMAVGRPVIATGTGGSAEYLRDGENCLICEPRSSPHALATAATRLARDEALRARLRDAGLVTAARFTERAYNEAIAATLDEVANGGGAPAGAHLYSAAP
jgi:glycosyltransferase involved in cell wall biosynthesis